MSILDHEAPKADYWLTAGTQAPRLQRLVDLIVDVATAAGRPVERPKLVDPDLIERLIRPVFLDALAPMLRRRFELMLALLCLYQRQEAFPSCIADLVDDAADLHLEQAFARSVEYCARKQGLGGREALAS